MSNSGSIVLQANQVSKTYESGPNIIEVIKPTDFVIRESEFAAITGSSGAGKSTLLNLLGGLDTPSSGKVVLNGNTLANIKEAKRCELRNRHMGFIYQFHHLLPEFTAFENVAMPLFISKDYTVKQAKQLAEELLERVGLGQRLSHKPAELSGGERQRVAIARALVNKPAVVLADEPTGNLDNTTAESIHQLMQKLNQELKTAFIIVTHDLDLAARIPTVWHLENGVLSLKE